MNTMTSQPGIAAYQTAYDVEFARMRTLGHSQTFAMVSAGRYAAKFLCVEVRS